MQSRTFFATSAVFAVLCLEPVFLGVVLVSAALTEAHKRLA